MKTLSSIKNRSKLITLTLFSLIFDNCITTSDNLHAYKKEPATRQTTENDSTYYLLRNKILLSDNDDFVNFLNKHPKININHVYPYEDNIKYEKDVFNEKVKNKEINANQIIRDGSRYCVIKAYLTLLNYAILQHNFEMVKELLKRGADVNQAFKYKGFVHDASPKFYEFLETQKAKLDAQEIYVRAALKHDDALAKFNKWSVASFINKALFFNDSCKNLNTSAANLAIARANVQTAKAIQKQAESNNDL